MLNNARATITALLLLAACGGASSTAPSPDPPEAVRPGCYVGASDPTVRGGDARRQADDDARSRAASSLLGTRVRTAARLGLGPRETVLVAIEETRGVVQGVAVIGWWRDREGAGAPGGAAGATPDTTWSVACVLGREQEALAALPMAFAGLPAWLQPARSTMDARCAVGVSGATVRPGDAVRQAEADARRRLAMQLCAVVDDVSVDDGTRAWRFADQRPSRAAEQVAEGADLRQTWTDNTGTGPLGEVGVAYARVCLEAPPHLPCAAALAEVARSVQE